jgi:hypothetical protein
VGKILLNSGHMEDGKEVRIILEWVWVKIKLALCF